MSARNDTLAKVDGQWRSAAEIYALVGMWAPTTVGQYLSSFANDGLIDRKVQPTPSGTIALYRVKPPETTDA